MANFAVRARLSQASSATVAPFGETDWKELKVLAGQTIEESARLDFPNVNVGTTFLIQWISNTQTVLGRTEVTVYPTNLLLDIKPLVGEHSLGVLDPQNQLKPLLKSLQIHFVNLEESDLADFSGRLAIIGPFNSKVQMPDGLAGQIKALAKRGTSVVWLTPAPEASQELTPSFYFAVEKTNAIVVVQSDLIADLSGNPQAQLNLIRFCQLALNPQLPALPGLTPSLN
jgi:hypothetical protein